MATDDRTNFRPTSAHARTARAKRTRWLWWALTAMVAVAGLGWVLSRAPQGQVRVSGEVALGDAAPDIALTDFDGERFELSDYEGKPLVVNFWASWCPSCVAEMPDFEEVHRATKGQIEFLGINQSDAPGAARELARETGVTYRLAADPQGEIFNAFDAPGMPTTVFIDASGNVVDVVVGQLSREMLTELIESSFPEHDVG
ncbi:MAG: TlpA family protein disulfide reductase [Actinobacteria bacterium]|nr:TlpA family protein disulfide reductase [Actinomycetota bacterium]